MTSEFEYYHFGDSLPEDSEEPISMVRTSDRISYVCWDELFTKWCALRAESFREKQLHIHDTMLKENWAVRDAANRAEKVLLANQHARKSQYTKSVDFKMRKEIRL
jgi:hypothetical protein